MEPLCNGNDVYSKVNLENKVSGKIVCCIWCFVPNDRFIRLSPVPGIHYVLFSNFMTRRNDLTGRCL